MKFSRVAQTYIGLLSVVALALVGAGTYVWQTGQITSKADEVVALKPAISLVSDTQTLSVGNSTTIDLIGDFQSAPTTGATVTLSYSPNLIEVSDVTAVDGILNPLANKVIDPINGTITLTFTPLLGVTDSGKIATISVKAKSVGTALINFVTDNSIAQSTVFTSATSQSLTPILSGTTLTIQ